MHSGVVAKMKRFGPPRRQVLRIQKTKILLFLCVFAPLREKIINDYLSSSGLCGLALISVWDPIIEISRKEVLRIRSIPSPGSLDFWIWIDPRVCFAILHLLFSAAVLPPRDGFQRCHPCACGMWAHS